MNVLILSAPLKLTTIALSETENPVNPFTPLDKLKNALGVLILYYEHNLQFQDCIPRTLSYAIADI